MQLGSMDLNKLRGLSDKAVGLYKEFLGTVLGNESLTSAGEAQQERATEQLRALRSEVKAEAKEAKAEVFEQKQRVAERAKRAS
jgi:uncharacterized protein YjbJ (UPF0337 family)